MTRAYHVTSSI